MVKLFPFDISISLLQKHLLNAALNRDKVRANAHFEKFLILLSSLDLDVNKAIKQLDINSIRLLPQLYLNLKDINHPFLDRISFTYKFNVVAGKFLLQSASELARIFEQNQVSFLLLKGLPIVLKSHKDFGIRPMSDLDILVKPSDFWNAIQLLETKMGLSINSYELELYNNNLTHAITFSNPGKLEIDLHCHFSDFVYDTKFDKLIWQSMEQLILLHGQAAFTPSSTYLLYRTLLHGIDTNAIRWVADSIALINIVENGVDWELLLIVAKKQKTSWPVKCRLNYLINNFPNEIPPYLPSLLGSIDDSWIEKIYFYYFSRRKNSIIHNNIKFKLVSKLALVLNYWLYRKQGEKDGFVSYFLKRRRIKLNLK